MKNKNILRKIRRATRVRSKLNGTPERPRVSVHKTNRFIYAQAIDDVNAKTIVSCSSVKFKADQKVTKTDEARTVGKTLGELLKKQKIEAVIFDRGSFSYNGRLKALAESLRETGIQV